MKVFAAFVVARVQGSSLYAATTRAADRGESGRFGLPGGKLDAGETPAQAAAREAAEEGWDVSQWGLTPIHSAIVDGQPVQWFYSQHSAKMRKNWKEKGRIEPISLSLDQLAKSGFGNDAAIAAVLKHLTPIGAHDC